MPEYPEVVVSVERLRDLARGQPLKQIRIAHPFLLRTVDPAPDSLHGLILEGVERLQKQIVLQLGGDRYLVLHLMISGRLDWRERRSRIPRRSGLAALDFPQGSLLVLERSTKKRASLHLLRGRGALRRFDRGGLEIMDATLDAFGSRLRAENHTLKRALIDQSILSGIGNAYSDEILHQARLSPFLRTQQLDDVQIEYLFHAARETLTRWTKRVRDAAGEGFPPESRAMRRSMAVHGKYGDPCPICSTPIQRIRYAARETNYCPRCQTEGRVLADRVLSRLLRDDWPRTVEELERGGA